MLFIKLAKIQPNPIFFRLGCSLVLTGVLLGLSLAAIPTISAAGYSYSCNEAGLDAALKNGGMATFNCTIPTTININSPKGAFADTILDGGGLLTLKGTGGMVLYNYFSNMLELRNMTVTGGVISQGGAIYNRSYGILTIRNCTFNQNNALGAGGAIFNHAYAKLIIINSTFTNNLSNQGGAIYNDTYAMLTVNKSSFTNNRAFDSGGAIYNASPIKASVTESTFAGNMAPSGGGIYNGTSALLSIINSAFTNQVSVISYTGGGGAALFNGTNATANVKASTFSGNTAGSGGAIYNLGVELNLTNSTVSGNSTSGGQGGGLYNAGSGVFLLNSTFTGNSAASGGGNIYNNVPYQVSLSNTIVANSGSGGNCIGYIGDWGSNLRWPATDGSCVGGIADPLLGPLANNGGPTKTHALLPGSPAINSGSGWYCTTLSENLDQRGAKRILYGQTDMWCDIGAFDTTLNLPSITKTFNPDEIQPGIISLVTFTLTNLNPYNTLHNVNFSDYLPPEIRVAATPDITNNCSTPGTVSILNLNSLVILSGTNLLPLEICTITVKVSSYSLGTWSNNTWISSNEFTLWDSINVAALTVCIPGVVSSTLDDGKCGTLRSVLYTTTSGPVTFNLPVPSTIILQNNGVTVPKGVSLSGFCLNRKPMITIANDAIGVDGHGLFLQGNSIVTGLALKGFNHNQIRLVGSGNRLDCVTTTR
ncbi:MAG: choice-of-anchor Q domain-containing protein [Chloroflexota bacterium]